MEGDKTSKAKSKINTRSRKYDKVATESGDDTNASSPEGEENAHCVLYCSFLDSFLLPKVKCKVLQVAKGHHKRSKWIIRNIR